MDPQMRKAQYNLSGAPNMGNLDYKWYSLRRVHYMDALDYKQYSLSGTPSMGNLDYKQYNLR